MKLDRSNPQRHWFQFSIKAVMILTLAAASFTAGKLSEHRRARDAERRARDQAEQARIVAEKSFRQAQDAVQQLAVQQARIAEPNPAVTRVSADEEPE